MTKENDRQAHVACGAPDHVRLPHIAAEPIFRALIQQCDAVLGAKGHDYTQGKGRLANFEHNAERLGVPPRTVLAVYIFKHIDALETWLRDGKTKSEPIEGRIVDIINYLFLLYMMMIEEAKTNQDAPTNVNSSYHRYTVPQAAEKP